MIELILLKKFDFSSGFCNDSGMNERNNADNRGPIIDTTDSDPVALKLNLIELVEANGFDSCDLERFRRRLSDTTNDTL